VSWRVVEERSAPYPATAAKSESDWMANNSFSLSQLVTQPAAAILESMEALEEVLGEQNALRVVSSHPVLLLGRASAIKRAWAALVEHLGEEKAREEVHRDINVLRPLPKLEMQVASDWT